MFGNPLQNVDMHLLTVYCLCIFVTKALCYSDNYGYVGYFRFDAKNFNETDIQLSKFPISFCIQKCSRESTHNHYAGIMASDCYCAIDYNISFKITNDDKDIKNTLNDVSGGRNRMYVFNLDYNEKVLVMVNGSQTFIMDIWNSENFDYRYGTVYTDGYIWSSYIANWDTIKPEYVSIVAHSTNGHMLWYVNISTINSLSSVENWLTSINLITFSNGVRANSQELRVSESKIAIVDKSDPEKYLFYHWKDEDGRISTYLSKDNKNHPLDGANHTCFMIDNGNTLPDKFYYVTKVESVSKCLSICPQRNPEMRSGILKNGDECFCENSSDCEEETTNDEDRMCLYLQDGRCCFKNLTVKKQGGCSNRCSLDGRRCGSSTTYSFYLENVSESNSAVGDRLFHYQNNLTGEFQVKFDQPKFVTKVIFTFELNITQNDSYNLMYRGIGGNHWTNYSHITVVGNVLESSSTVAADEIVLTTDSDLRFNASVYEIKSNFLPIDRLSLYGYYHVTEPRRSKWHYLQYLPPAEIEAILRDELAALKKKIEINQRNTTSYLRSKKSVIENRPVANSVGSVYVILIVVIVVGIVILDIAILRKHLRFAYENICRFIKYVKSVFNKTNVEDKDDENSAVGETSFN